MKVSRWLLSDGSATLSPELIFFSKFYSGILKNHQKWPKYEKNEEKFSQLGSSQVRECAIIKLY